MKNEKIFEIIHVGMMIGIVLVCFILFILLPKDIVSENEKRELTAFPTFTVEKFLSKSYSEQIDLYVNDAFPFREQLIELSSFYRNVKGKRSGTDEIQIYNIDK